jgi:thioesterase domain-containing protein/glutathione synthase/RimK-type ligase-like ATP-grasp enzyme
VIHDELRRGTGDTVFMICGAGGAAEELAGLAEVLDGDPRVIALVPLPAPDGAEATTVEDMATAAVALMRSNQPHGPYRLLGYSLGGIVALETGRLLQEAGERVNFLGLVDALFDRRYWPGPLFLRASLRRALVHARELVGKPPLQAWRELRDRIRRLAGRVRSRRSPQDGADNPAGTTIQEANLAAMARWQPRVFEGQIVLFTAEDTDFGCDLAELWRPWLPGLQVRRVPGNHLELVQDPSGIHRLAQVVDEALDASASPRLHTLVAATFRWSGAARLAVELKASGCIVQAVAPKGSALHKIAAVERSYVLGLINPVGSLRRAIESSSADVIIPFDDRTRRAMHRIHAGADPTTHAGARLRRRLERSLGPAELYSCLYSRVAIMDIAAECGVRCPPTGAVRSAADITRWLTDHPGRAVLKTDGSWGGRETKVIRTAEDARKAWRQLRRRTGFARCVKRVLIERDPWPLRARLTGYRPRLSIQAYVEGAPGNAAVACLEGDLLGAVQAEVVRSNGPTGPSTVLRIVEHPEMLAAARTMVHRLRLSGLGGLDFILENDTGRAHLIEVNPRATPTSYLISAEGIDLLASLRSALGHAGPSPRTAPYSDRLVALFPQELERDPSGAILNEAFHDVPWHAPDLVAHALADVPSPASNNIRARLASLARTTAGSSAQASPAQNGNQPRTESSPELPSNDGEDRAGRNGRNEHHGQLPDQLLPSEIVGGPLGLD